MHLPELLQYAVKESFDWFYMFTQLQSSNARQRSLCGAYRSLNLVVVFSWRAAGAYSLKARLCCNPWAVNP